MQVTCVLRYVCNVNQPLAVTSTLTVESVVGVCAQYIYTVDNIETCFYIINPRRACAARVSHSYHLTPCIIIIIIIYYFHLIFCISPTQGASYMNYYYYYYCSSPVCMHVCVYACMCVCMCVHSYLPPRTIRRTNGSISDFSAIRA